MLTVHTVVSRFNQHRFREIYNDLQFLEPDSYITEVAEERVELDTVGWGITPDPDAYAPIADFLSEQAKARPAKGIARFTQAFRAHYYQLARRVLYERTQVIACYAGWASAHIAPNGDIWSCCIRAEPVGNLRETGYDLAPSGTASGWRRCANRSTTRSARVRWRTPATPTCCCTRRRWRRWRWK